MFVKIFGSSVYGVEAIPITVEVNWTSQGKEYCIVGLPDSAIKESVQRVESALKSNKFEMPRTRIVINLAPADIRKTGTAFDLPIAMGILVASEQLAISPLFQEHVIMGELSLDGKLRPIRGALPIALQARKDGYKGLIIPSENSKEAAMVSGLNVYGMESLLDVVEFFKSEGTSKPPIDINIEEKFLNSQIIFQNDFSEVKGQDNIKRALEIAASGGHNVILIRSARCWENHVGQKTPFHFTSPYFGKRRWRVQKSIVLRESCQTTQHSSPDALFEVHTIPFQMLHW